MKRAAAALVSLGLAAMVTAPAFAANPTGAVKMTWTVAATATMTLATNYGLAAGAPQGLGANVLQGSPAATCTSGTTETALNLTFGSLTGSAVAETACNYKQAVAATVITNDTLGFKVQEWLDQAPTAGIQFCAFPNATASPTNGPASINAAAPAPIAAGTCAAGGILIPAGSAATGAGAGQPGTAGIRNSTAPGVPAAFGSGAAATATSIFGEDIQINLAANQASTAAGDSSFLIVSLIPN